LLKDNSLVKTDTKGHENALNILLFNNMLNMIGHSHSTRFIFNWSFVDNVFYYWRV